MDDLDSFVKEISQSVNGNNNVVVGGNLTIETSKKSPEELKSERGELIKEYIESPNAPYKKATTDFAKKHFGSGLLKELTDKDFFVVWDYFLAQREIYFLQSDQKHQCAYCRSAEISQAEAESELPYCPVCREKLADAEIAVSNKRFRLKFDLISPFLILIFLAPFLYLLPTVLNKSNPFVVMIIAMVGVFSIVIWGILRIRKRQQKKIDAILKKYDLEPI